MSKPHEGSEKRGATRVRINLDVIYKVNKPVEIRMQIGDREVHASMLDLSLRGLAVLTDYQIPKSTELGIRFSLVSKEGHFRSIELTGEVCYNVELVHKQFRLGIRFLKVEEKDLDIINHFIKLLTTAP